MTWSVTGVMEQKMRFVREVLDGDFSVTELCEFYNISRTTGYKWLGRYRASGLEGLQELSRKPNRSPGQVNQKVEDAILQIKKRHSTFGARKILVKLVQQFPGWSYYPCVNTVGNILQRHGLTVDRRRKVRARPTPTPLTQGVKPNDVWAADFKGHFLTKDKSRCNPLTISDDASRYLLCCQHVDKMTFANVKMQYEKVFREFGLPLVMRTDNGSPFAGHGLCGLSRLGVWLIRLGIKPERIRPGNPQQNGRHERMHRTLKDIAIKPAAKTLRSQQQKFNEFINEYNEERPHESLEMKTPGECYFRSDRVYRPKLKEIDYGNLEVRRVKVHGDIAFKGHRYFLSEALAGATVGLEEVDDDCWLVNFSHLELGKIDLHRRTFTPKKV